jgi:hypothetical protein
MFGMGVEQRLHIRCGKLAAEMNEVFGFQQCRVRQGVDVGNSLNEGPLAVLLKAEVAHAEGVEDGGDPCARALSVVGDHGGARRPAGIDSGLNLAFEIIGMEVDDARDQQIALEVYRGGGMTRRRIDPRDAPVLRGQAPVQHPVGKHEACIGEDALGHERRR